MKFKVNDLIHDGHNLFRVVDISSLQGKEFTLEVIKSIRGNNIGMLVTVSEKTVENYAHLFDINDPPMKAVNKGAAACHQCGEKLDVGDYCVRDNSEHIFCSLDCLDEYHGAEESEVGGGDLTDSRTVTIPVFDITKEELEKVKKEVSEHAVTE